MASALWHGVTLNFLIWGSLHAFVFCTSVWALKRGFKIFPLVSLIIGVVLGRLIFADTDIDRLFEKLLFSFDGFEVFSLIVNSSNTAKLSLAMGLMLILIEFVFRNHSLVSKRNYKYLRTPLALIVICSITILLISTGGTDFAVYGQR